MSIKHPTAAGAHQETSAQLLERSLALLEEITAQHWRRGPGGRWARRDLSLAQMNLLMVLHEAGAATIGHLAETLQISLPSTSSAVDRLVDHGLAVRQRDREDRRVVHVVLAAKGREAAEQACGFRRNKASRLLSRFQRPELEALLTVLAAVQRCLEEDS